MPINIDRISNAICELQVALQQSGLEPCTAIEVPRNTGRTLRSQPIDSSRLFEHDYKLAPVPGYCGTICGVPFYFEQGPRRGS